MGKHQRMDMVYKLVYVAIAEVLLMKKLKMGEDSCIDPDRGREISADIAHGVMKFVTPLELLLDFLEQKGYTDFFFKDRTIKEYYRYEFTAQKADGSQDFIRTSADAPTGLITFQGKSKEECVYNAISSINEKKVMVGG